MRRRLRSEEATSFAVRRCDVVAQKMRRRLPMEKRRRLKGRQRRRFFSGVSVFKPRPKLLHAFCAHTSLLITLSEDDDDHNNEEDDDHCSRSGSEGCAVSTAGRHYRRSQDDEGRRSAFSGNV